MGPLAKNIPIQTLENVLKDKNKSGSFQGLETVFLKSKKKEGPEIVEFWKNVAVATYSFYHFAKSHPLIS